MYLEKVIQRLWAERAAGRGKLRLDRSAVGRSRGGPSAEAVLERLAEEIRACRKCPLGSARRNAVPGEGNPEARLVFVGEAPGGEEDKTGRPFVGAAGQLLTRMIAAMGLRREDVFIANVLKCRPPGNRDPEPEEVAACRNYLRSQLAVIRPELVIALGAYATRWFLGAQARVTRIRGRLVDMGDFKLLATFHPSYLLRYPAEKGKAWEDLKTAMRFLSLPIPASRNSPSTRSG